MSNVVDKKQKNKPTTDLYILSISVNGEVTGSFKMEGFGLPNFKDSWDYFIEGYARRLYGKESVDEAKDNTDELTLPEKTNISASFSTSVNGNLIQGNYTPFFSIGI